VVERIANEVLLKINDLNEFLSRINWKQLDRKTFMRSLSDSIEKVEELQNLLKKLMERIEKSYSIDKPDLKPLIEEFNKTLTVLRRNLLMEESKKDLDEPFLKTQIVVPELYSSISEKINNLLLRARYAMERVYLHAKEEKISPLTEKSTAKQIMQLLKAKEKELQELKEKYEDLKHHAFMAKVGEKDSAEVEKELNNIAKKFETELNFALHDLNNFNKKIEKLSESFLELKNKSSKLEEIFSKFSEKLSDLTVLLKKERDFAKKTLLDIEHETLRLRSAYSREILNLHESKLKAREEAVKEVNKKLMALEKEVIEKNALIDRLQKMVAERDKKIEKLIEKLHSVRAHAIHREYKKRIESSEKSKTKKR
jgi:predicted  nucleic acid-binding Zn-ribbon protein